MNVNVTPLMFEGLSSTEFLAVALCFMLIWVALQTRNIVALFSWMLVVTGTILWFVSFIAIGDLMLIAFISIFGTVLGLVAEGL